MPRQPKYTPVSGPPSVATGEEFLNSGHFDHYDKDSTVSIANVELVDWLQLGKVTYTNELVATFEPTAKGRKPMRLVLKANHKSALRAACGLATETWRGPVSVFCAKNVAKIDNVLFDGVRIRHKRPQVGAQGAQLRAAPSDDGGVGRKSEPEQAPAADDSGPKREPTAEDVNRTLDTRVPRGTLGSDCPHCKPGKPCDEHAEPPE